MLEHKMGDSMDLVWLPVDFNEMVDRDMVMRLKQMKRWTDKVGLFPFIRANRWWFMSKTGMKTAWSFCLPRV